MSRNQSSRQSAIYVEKSELLDDLIQDISASYRLSHRDSSIGSLENSTASNSKKSIDYSRTHTTSESQQRVLREYLLSKREYDDAVTKANIQKVMVSRAAKQETKVKQLGDSISDAMKFLDVVDKDLKVYDETIKNKTRRQFEEWNTNVHGSIQMNIVKQINKINSKQLNRKKNKDYNKFLNITNKKSAIFRDIIIESEYDPLEPNRRAIKARTGPLTDPTLHDMQKARGEASMIGDDSSTYVGSRGGKATVLGKETLPVELWASGKIEATPYGTFAKMMSKNNKDNSGSSGSETHTHRSNITFDHFRYPVDRASVDAEMPRGKRVFPVSAYSDPGRVFSSTSLNVMSELADIKIPSH